MVLKKKYYLQSLLHEKNEISKLQVKERNWANALWMHKLSSWELWTPQLVYIKEIRVNYPLGCTYLISKANEIPEILNILHALYFILFLFLNLTIILFSLLLFTLLLFFLYSYIYAYITHYILSYLYLHYCSTQILSDISRMWNESGIKKKFHR